jgi:hypothetical protein
MCFPQGAPKKEKKKKRDVPTYIPFLRFFKIFRSDFRKYCYGVFGLLMQRKTVKNTIKKIDGNRQEKVFDMDSPQKVCFGVVELTLLKNAQKRRHKKIFKFCLKKVPTYPI